MYLAVCEDKKEDLDWVCSLLDHLHLQEQKYSEALPLKASSSFVRIPYTQISCVEVIRKNVYFHLTDGTVRKVTGTLKDFEATRIERHDMRHQLQTIASLAQRGDYAALLDYVGSSQEKLDAITPKRYCSHPALDAILVNAAVQAGPSSFK